MPEARSFWRIVLALGNQRHRSLSRVGSRPDFSTRRSVAICRSARPGPRRACSMSSSRSRRRRSAKKPPNTTQRAMNVSVSADGDQDRHQADIEAVTAGVAHQPIASISTLSRP